MEMNGHVTFLVLSKPGTTGKPTSAQGLRGTLRRVRRLLFNLDRNA
jgi:hypothetical protein